MNATQEQIQAAIGRIDQVLDTRRIEPALTRQEHVQLAQDLRIIQEQVKASYELINDLELAKRRIKVFEQHIEAEDEADERTDQRTDDD